MMKNKFVERTQVETVNNPCPLCGSSNRKKIIPVLLSPFRMETLLMKCLVCQVNYASPIPSTQDEIQFYTAEHHNIEPLEGWRENRLPFFQWAVKQLCKRTSGRKLLDVGCGPGFFIQEARRKGWQAQGTELSKDAADYAQKELGLEIGRGPIRDLKFAPESFDVISAWNVLDQMRQPAEEILEMYRLLRPGGCLALRVSNAWFHIQLRRLGLQLEKCRKGTAIHLPTVFHLVMFDPMTLYHFLIKAGFSPVTVLNSPLSPKTRVVVDLLGTTGSNFSQHAVYFAAEAARYLSGGRCILGPSLVAFACKARKNIQS